MKGKIISTAITVPFTFLVLWTIVTSGLGVFALIMAAVVIIAVFFSLLKVWEANPKTTNGEEGRGIRNEQE